MRHSMRRSIEIIVLAIISFPMWDGAIAQEGSLDGRLHGDYSVTVARTCDNGFAFAVKGTANFDGTGGGTFIGQSLLEPIGNQASLNCTSTYSVNADGTFTETLNCNITFTAGPADGNTATLSGLELNGELALGGNVLLLHKTTTTSETQTFTSGPNAGQPVTRTCNASGVA